MKWEDFKVGQTIRCSDWVCEVISINIKKYFVEYKVLSCGDPYNIGFISDINDPDVWELVKSKEDKFNYHKKRVEQRHLLKKKV